ncbi:MAG: Rnf-Nqr domain containing protein [Candidatus Auribacterota bacterium]|nr:Rnf-Nqr domain containing protein [Candidatus Auribacterota bacterium]
MSLAVIFFAAIVTNNIVLIYFLGICPFISVSKDMETALGMGIAVTSVMVATVALNWPVNYFLLEPFSAQYLQYAVFIMIIAVLVQIVEVVVDRYFPVLYAMVGVFLPLITVNCSILGVILFSMIRGYSYVQSLVFAGGCGIGWTLAILAMSAIRMKLRFSSVPLPLQGIGITMIIAALMAMGFLGFSGWISL